MARRTLRLRLRSARLRILASYLVLLLFSTVVGTIALREVLNARAGERVDDALVQESEEFRRLARDGRDPRTGERFGNDVGAIFEVFLQRNVPGEGEAFYTYIGGDFFDARFASGLRAIRIAEIDAAAIATESVVGEAELEDGRRVRYLAVPVRAGGDASGVFAVAIDLTSELEEVNDALQVAAGVGIGVLLLASLLAWVVAGRVLAPLRDLRDTARSIGESDLTGRIAVEGDDELAGLARTFNEMLDRLETAFASQKAFISDAGHELRTPITIIRGHLDVMGDDPEERRETLELVRDELDRMGRLVNDLLLLARAEPARLPPARDARPRRPDPRAVRQGLRRWPSATGASAAVGSGRIVADRQRLTQALMNLSQNAVAHTHEGDAVELGSQLANGDVRLWVRDTGPGVPEHEQARIFERFARAERLRQPRRRRGAGTRHHTRDRRGPRRPRRAGQPPGRRRSLHRRHPDRATAGGAPEVKRILIAEDEPRLSSFLEKGLRSNGFMTTVAEDGAKASVLARDDEFDLLVLDLGLPGKDGVEVLRELRASGQRMPVIILTARDDVSDKVSGLEGGADDYVTKPFRFEELLARVRVRLRDERTVERTVLKAGAIALDLRTRRASADGRTVDLTAREFTMLEVLIRHAGQVLSREQLLSHVWGYDYDPGSNVVDVYVGYLRKKLGSEAIETVRGMGYRLSA